MSLTAGISHVGLTVPSLPCTTKFFEAVGFSKVGGDEKYPSVFLSDGNTLITLWQTKVETPVKFDRTANIGLHHVAIKVKSLDSLNKAFSTVKAMDSVKIEFEPRNIEGMPLSHFMCYEPGGVRVEFTYHHQ